MYANMSIYICQASNYNGMDSIINLKSMKKKKSILLSAKITLCAMLLVLTAGVASASTAGDFAFNAQGTVEVVDGSNYNLALEVTIPDGVNNPPNPEDTLIYDGSTNGWTGDTLNAFTGNNYYLDHNGSGSWDPTNGVSPEAVWADTNTNGNIDAGEIQVQGYADLEAFNATGPTLWVADSVANDSPVGTSGGGSYLSADYNPGEALFRDVNNTGALDQGDALIKGGLASVMNFDSTAANPGGVCGTGGGCHGYTNVDDIYWCDGPGGVANGAYDSGESIFMDVTPSPQTGDYDPGTDVMLVDPTGIKLAAAPSCAISGGTPLPLTAGGPHPVVFLDADKSGSYGDFSVLGGTAIARNIPAPIAEPILDLNIPIGDQAQLAIANVSAIAIADSEISNLAPDWSAFDAIPMNLAGSGNLKFIGGTPSVADIYSGVEPIVDENLGGTLSVLEPGEIVENASVPPAGGLHNNFVINFKYLDDGNGFFDSADDIYDESTALIANTLEKAEDELNAITLQNAGSMLQTDISAVQVWADGGNDMFDQGILDDDLLGTATWDTTDSWDLDISGVPYLFFSGGQKLFVTVDIVASPESCKTIELFIPQLVDAATAGSYDASDEGIFVASSNDGPTDANAAPATTNVLSTACGGGGGGGSTSGVCGDGVLDELESCDDGNRTAGDGCNEFCSLEDGYVWDSETETVVEEETTEEETTGEETTEEETTEETPYEVTSDPLDQSQIDDVADNFSDYDSSHWAAEYIAKLYLAEIMTGYGDGDMFGVAEGTTRAEIVKIALLANNVEIPETVSTAPFNDTPLGEWYTPYVAKAANLEIVEGYEDGNFRPGNMVNRAEALKILLLAKGVDVEGYDLSSATSFSDVSESIWYAVYVAYAVDNELIEGYEDGTFKGANDILRAEIAKLTVMIMLHEMAA